MGCSNDKILVLLKQRDILKQQENRLKTRLKELQDATRWIADPSVETSLENSLLEDSFTGNRFFIKQELDTLQKKINDMRISVQKQKISSFVRAAARSRKFTLQNVVRKWRYNIAIGFT